jgi:hypothetical protein
MAQIKIDTQLASDLCDFVSGFPETLTRNQILEANTLVEKDRRFFTEDVIRRAPRELRDDYRVFVAGYSAMWASAVDDSDNLSDKQAAFEEAKCQFLSTYSDNYSPSQRAGAQCAKECATFIAEYKQSKKFHGQGEKRTQKTSELLECAEQVRDGSLNVN